MRAIPLHRVVMLVVTTAIAGCQHAKPARASAPGGAAAAGSVREAPPKPAPSAALVLVARVVGEVTSTIGDQRTSLHVQQQVPPRARIETSANASVVLAFSNGVMIFLGAESALAIEEFTQAPFSGAFHVVPAEAEPSTSVTRLKLLRGEVVGHVKRLNRAGGSTFQVETPLGKVQLADAALAPSSASGGAAPQVTAPIAVSTVKGMQSTTRDFEGGRAHAIFRIVFRPAGTTATRFQLSTAVGAVRFSSGGEPGVVVPQGREIVANVALAP